MDRIVATIPFEHVVRAKGPLTRMMRDLLGKIEEAGSEHETIYEIEYRALAGVLAALETGEAHLS